MDKNVGTKALSTQYKAKPLEKKTTARETSTTIQRKTFGTKYAYKRRVDTRSKIVRTTNKTKNSEFHPSKEAWTQCHGTVNATITQRVGGKGILQMGQRVELGQHHFHERQALLTKNNKKQIRQYRSYLTFAVLYSAGHFVTLIVPRNHTIIPVLLYCQSKQSSISYVEVLDEPLGPGVLRLQGFRHGSVHHPEVLHGTSTPSVGGHVPRPLLLVQSKNK